MKEYATYCGKLSWRNSKVENTCDHFEYKVVVAVTQRKIKRVEDHRRRVKNLQSTSKHLVFTNTCL